MVKEGCVDSIIYRNEENGYTVLELSCKGEDEAVTCVGSFTYVAEGEYLSVEGNEIKHPVYGVQLQIVKYEVKEPEDSVSIERYLASGAIKGIGKTMASRIVAYFGDDTFRIMDEEPERLSEIKGISSRIAREISRQFIDKRELRNSMLFLQQYGITSNLAVKIHKQYGQRMYEIIKENPYRMAEEISGVGFKTVDEIAARVGIIENSEYRIRAGILYALTQASAGGHTYLPENELIRITGEMLHVPVAGIEQQIDALAIDHKLIINEAETRCVYSSVFYYMELNTARMLLDLNIRYDIAPTVIERRLSVIEENFELSLDEMQRQAVLEAARNGLLVLTGGPGTGKTTTINAIIRFFEAEGMDILLAAPTGRAAKRICETTGKEARTIHRLLELKGGDTNMLNDKEVAGNTRYTFERNESNPLEADVIIIDEMSMVDIGLINALLKAVCIGTRLVLVGDVNQLPSVGPGNVLRDIINSGCFNVIKLTKIFRQAAESDIVVNAHKINKGESILLDNKSRDFFFMQREDADTIAGIIVSLVRDRLPKYVNTESFNIQVLTPMRKGELGVERLNNVLQHYLNPEDSLKQEKEYHQVIFREGDKVMQVKNNYQTEWEIRNSKGIAVDGGMGIFNGDCGVIRDINNFAELMTIEFDEGRIVEYPFTQLDELELAYAVTIHKSQGSEYPAVVIPLLTGPMLLFNRNLLYTAVTRAKSCVTIVGSRNTVQSMIDNENEQKRYSGLCLRIQEMDNSAAGADL